jgi:phage regulator Rha-like protein
MLSWVSMTHRVVMSIALREWGVKESCFNITKAVFMMVLCLTEEGIYTILDSTC